MGKSIKGGAIGSAIGSLGGAAAGAVGGIAGLFGGGGGSPGPQLDMSRFDYKKDIEERTKPSREASLKLLTELQEQAAGRGPSLAEAQLKSATSRNLAQTLAAAQAARGGSPALQQRELQRAQTETGRQLIEQSAVARMQEQQAALQQLGQLAIQQQAQDLSQVTGYANPMMAYEQARFAEDVARRNRVKQEQSALRGQLLGAGATILGGFAGAPAAAKATPAIGGGGGQYLDPSMGLYAGGRVEMAAGGAVPEDSPENDVVPAKLSPGEIVLPRSVATKKDAPKRAKQFVEALLQLEKSTAPEPVAPQPQVVPNIVGFAQVLAEMQKLKQKGK